MLSRQLVRQLLTKNTLVSQGALRQVALTQSMIRHFAIVKKYTKTHEWIEYDTVTKEAKIGITNYAQSEMGDIVHVSLPSIGTQFSASESISCVESVKTAADVYQMIDGEVVEVNEELEDDASIVNQDAEGKGWIMKIKVSDSSVLDDLHDQDPTE